ncbi:hypothetical protein [Xanthomarina sp.]|uniref:DUF7793 family protein n=1 Tax=Xanthomarina sp. TaxID=1931211 RepID=UPI002B5C9028|nr:hypothetical protein [Xanthomarina sp.]HLV38085.1 hypothetical protein [Xanthomarina sp.]
MNNLILNESEKVKFRIENGVLICEFSDVSCRLTENKIKTYIHHIEIIAQGKPMPFLINIKSFVGSFSIPAAKLFANSPVLKKIRISEAFVVDTLNGKLLVNSYKRIYEPETTFQVFSTVEDAFVFCVESKNKFYARQN